MGINGDFFGNLGRMQTGLKKPRLYIHHLFGLMQFTVQYCFHVICMYVPKCRERRHRQISGRFPMSHVDLGYFREGGLRSHVDLGTIGLTGLRSQDDMGQNPRWYTALVWSPAQKVIASYALESEDFKYLNPPKSGFLLCYFLHTESTRIQTSTY